MFKLTKETFQAKVKVILLHLFSRPFLVWFFFNLSSIKAIPQKSAKQEPLRIWHKDFQTPMWILFFPLILSIQIQKQDLKLYYSEIKATGIPEIIPERCTTILHSLFYHYVLKHYLSIHNLNWIRQSNFMLITSVAVKHIIFFWNTALLRHWTRTSNDKENILIHIYEVLEGGKHLANKTWHSQCYALQKQNLVWFPVSLNSKWTKT